jgi:hypothetical protein
MWALINRNQSEVNLVNLKVDYKIEIQVIVHVTFIQIGIKKKIRYLTSLNIL